MPFRINAEFCDNNSRYGISSNGTTTSWLWKLSENLIDSKIMIAGALIVIVSENSINSETKIPATPLITICASIDKSS